MSKNMTRKGLAFGAGLSLVVSGFAALPAQATGLTGLIGLAPSTGPSTALSVIARDGATFSLQASPASTVMGSGSIKFLVNDSTGKLLPGPNTTGGDSDALADGTADMNDADATLDVVALDVDGVADGNYLMWASSDVVLDDGNSDATATTVLPKDTLVQAVVDSDFVTFKSTVDITQAELDGINGTPTLNFVKGGDAITDTDAIGAGDLAGKTNGAPGTGRVQLTLSGVANGTYLFYTEAALRLGDASDNTIDVTVLNPHEVVSIVVDNNVGTFSNPRGTVASVHDEIEAGVNAVFIKADTLGSARAADNSYVVDSGQNTAGDRPVLELVASETDVTRSATVTAFNDIFADDTIQSTEYVSPAVSVSFVDIDAVSWSSTLSAPIPGAETLTATISTTPLLNGAQLHGDYDVRALFTRAGSSTALLDDANATQSDVTGLWTSSIDLELASVTLVTDGAKGSNAGFTLATDGAPTAAGWAGGLLTPDVSVAGTNSATPTGTVLNNTIKSIAVTAAKVVTVTTTAAHQLTSGDKVTLTKGSTVLGTEVTDASMTARTVTVTSATTFTFSLDTTATITAVSKADADVETDTNYAVVTYTTGDTTNQYFRASRVFAGDYSATAYYTENNGTNWLKGSTASALGTSAAIADDVKFTTVSTASVQGSAVTTNDDTTDSRIKSGTLTAEVVATVLDEDGDAVGAGRAVVWSFTRSAATSQVNGRSTGTTTLTDANGQVKFTVTDTLGLSGTTVKITATAEGVSTSASSFTFEWATQAYSLYDLNTSGSSALAASTTRRVAPGASYDVALFLADQWYQAAPDADYRVKVSGTGVTEGFVNLTGGKATVKVTDSKVATSFVSNLTVQKKGTTGVFADTTTTVALTTATSDKGAVTLGANATALYGTAVAGAKPTVDLADLVAEKALVERDNRVAFVEQPAYVNDVVIAGKINNSTTGVGFEGAVVTVSGPTSILFSDGAVDKRGSITVVANSDGEFSVVLYSTTAQTDTVITVASMGASSTTKVTFTGIGVGEGTKLDVTTPAVVDPASTFQVKAKLSDTFGNGVEATAGRIKVTYTGPGIVFGTLPDKTDKNGELSFSVLLGSADKGSITVLVSYDQNGDADFVDAKDLNTTKTITVGSTVEVAAKIGSFNGRVAVRVENAKGSTISVKIGRQWYKYSALNNNYLQSWRSAKGRSVAVSVYVDGELQNVQTITVR